MALGARGAVGYGCGRRGGEFRPALPSSREIFWATAGHPDREARCGPSSAPRIHRVAFTGRLSRGRAAGRRTEAPPRIQLHGRNPSTCVALSPPGPGVHAHTSLPRPGSSQHTPPRPPALTQSIDHPHRHREARTMRLHSFLVGASVLGCATAFMPAAPKVARSAGTCVGRSTDPGAARHVWTTAQGLFDWGACPGSETCRSAPLGSGAWMGWHGGSNRRTGGRLTD